MSEKNKATEYIETLLGQADPAVLARALDCLAQGYVPVEMTANEEGRLILTPHGDVHYYAYTAIRDLQKQFPTSPVFNNADAFLVKEKNSGIFDVIPIVGTIGLSEE